MNDPRQSPAPSQTPQEALAQQVPWLLGWFRRRVGRAEAEDLAQEALLIALRNHARIRRPDGLAAYLLGIARHLARQPRRAQPVVEATPQLAATPPAPDPDRQVTEALQSLPPQLAQVVHAYYAEERTYEQVAALLGLSRATVQSRLRRAIQQLRQTLTRTARP